MYLNTTDKEKGELLSILLSDVCNTLEEIDVLTGGVNVDIDYLLGIEGSYHIGIREGEIDPEGDTHPPSVLYEESLFPSLENAKGIEVEVIEEGEDVGEYNNDTDDEGDAA